MPRTWAGGVCAASKKACVWFYGEAPALQPKWKIFRYCVVTIANYSSQVPAHVFCDSVTIDNRLAFLPFRLALCRAPPSRYSLAVRAGVRLRRAKFQIRGALSRKWR